MSIFRKRVETLVVVSRGTHWRIVQDEDGSDLYYQFVIFHRGDGVLRQGYLRSDI
jgi:hypothetical protein